MPIGKRQPQRVRFDPLQGPLRRPSSLLRRLLCRALQHGVRKIGAKYLRRSRARAPAQRESHVSRTATKIQHACLGTLQNGLELPCRAPPPQAVNVERKNMIQQVVARRNRGEHFSDSTRGRLAVLGTSGSRTHNPRICFLIHRMDADGEPGVLARPPYRWTLRLPPRLRSGLRQPGRFASRPSHYCPSTNSAPVSESRRPPFGRLLPARPS